MCNIKTHILHTFQNAISSGVYLSGTITILGSSNLVSGNIKSGVKIFNVTGTYVTPGAPITYELTAKTINTALNVPSTVISTLQSVTFNGYYSYYIDSPDNWGTGTNNQCTHYFDNVKVSSLSGTFIAQSTRYSEYGGSPEPTTNWNIAKVTFKSSTKALTVSSTGNGFHGCNFTLTFTYTAS